MNDLASDISTAGAAATSTAIALPSAIPAVAAATDASEKPRRGRKPETPAQRLERLERQLAEAKVAAREAERRKCAVVGEAVLAEAEADGAFRARVVDVLRRRVTTAGARSDIASVLAE